MIEYSSFLEHSISELPKTPKKIKKVQKSVNKSQVFKSLPSQINFVNKLKEKVELQMKDMQTALEKSQKRVEDRKNLIVFLETYKKNNLGKIIMSEEVNEKVTENDCFVQSIDVSGQSRTVNPGVNKFALKRKKSLKIQRNFFSYISFCSSILCIKIF
jgi:septal ring factor EnvC (AmiA/AmiB activator)